MSKKHQIEFLDDDVILNTDGVIRRIKMPGDPIPECELNDDNEYVILDPKTFFSASFSANKNGFSLYSIFMLKKYKVKPKVLIIQPFINGGGIDNARVLGLACFKVSELRDFKVNFKHDPSLQDPISARGKSHILMATNPHPLSSMEYEIFKTNLASLAFIKKVGELDDTYIFDNDIC
jgi:hypothetical protein